MAEVSAPFPDASKQTFAALDLGSNSFHLIVAIDQGERLQVVDKHREMVRLAEGLGDRQELSPATSRRALACLERLGQRLRELPARNVRVVGTNALRKARNSRSFVRRAEKALGHRIEIISGREEARLIYLGVSHSLEDDLDSRLVVDIGGGSTEIILGRRFQPRLMESLFIGCVGLSDRFFPDGTITQSAMEDAERAARQELGAVEQIFLARGWDTAIGASGTVLAICGVAETETGAKEITADGLRQIRTRVLEAGHVDRLEFEAVGVERAPVFPGGVAILSAVFESLRIERMSVSDGALREGLLHDLLGRVHDEDIRDRTVRDLAKRYHIDHDHAGRVSRTAGKLLEQVGPGWGLADPDLAAILRWGATLHEIGLDIAHTQYHKHGGYLLDNMDLPGFSRPEQHQVSLLVRAHRRKFPTEDFADAEDILRLCVLLRIAVVLHRGRTDARLPSFGISARGHTVRLWLPGKWLQAHPLTQLDLKQEAEYLGGGGIRLQVSAR